MSLFGTSRFQNLIFLSLYLTLFFLFKLQNVFLALGVLLVALAQLWLQVLEALLTIAELLLQYFLFHSYFELLVSNVSWLGQNVIYERVREYHSNGCARIKANLFIHEFTVIKKIWEIYNGVLWQISIIIFILIFILIFIFIPILKLYLCSLKILVLSELIRWQILNQVSIVVFGQKFKKLRHKWNSKTNVSLVLKDQFLTIIKDFKI